MNGRRLLSQFAIGAVVYGVARAAVIRKVRAYEDLDADTAPHLPGVRLYLRGRRIHLTIEGEGPPLLVLHGFGASGAAFRRLAPLLREHLTLITPDLPGFGYSERSPDSDHSHEANAGLMLELLDRLGISSVAVLGHSVGAAIALRMATTAPSRVTALILVGGPGRDPALPRWTRPLLTVAVPPAVESRRGQRWLNQSAMARGARVDETTVSSYLREARVQGHAATLMAMLTQTRYGPAPNLADVRMPALVISGAADRYFSPSCAEELASGLPSAELRIVEDAGHLVLEERPEVAAESILAFLRASGVPPAEGIARAPSRDSEAVGP